MSLEKFDVAIVGSGIGGACAAISLASSGAKVLLLEAGRFPRHKVCGEFLSPESKAVFSRLGVLDKLHEAGALPVQTARIVARGGRALAFPLPQSALALSRFRLDNILAVAAQNAAARLLTRTRVRALEEGTEGWRVASARGEFWARAVINSAGRNSARLQNAPQSTLERAERREKYIGLKAHFSGAGFPAGAVELHIWRGGYCGLVQVEEGMLNVCLLASYESLAGRSPQEFWEWLQKYLPALRARTGGAKQQTLWKATGNIGFGAAAPVAGNLWNCGDAAGFIHPLASDGMAMAARSGELAAAILKPWLRGEIPEDTAREVYAAAWRREFNSRLRWASRFQKLLVGSRLLSWPFFPVLACMPQLTQFAVRATRGSA